jgi:hypothetical protein
MLRIHLNLLMTIHTFLALIPGPRYTEVSDEFIGSLILKVYSFQLCWFSNSQYKITASTKCFSFDEAKKQMILGEPQ